jgi:hypothetical protein
MVARTHRRSPSPPKLRRSGGSGHLSPRGRASVPDPLFWVLGERNTREQGHEGIAEDLLRAVSPDAHWVQPAMTVRAASFLTAVATVVTVAGLLRRNNRPMEPLTSEQLVRAYIR